MVNNNFAQFHHQIYQMPEAVKAINHFEKRKHWYPSLTLLMLWHIKNHLGRLTQSQLKTLQNTIGAWHERIINPLRRLQKLLIKQKTSELTAEIEQLLEFSLVYEVNLLETNLPVFRHNKRADKLLVSDACQNIIVYCKLISCKLDQEEISALKQLLAVVFDTHEQNDINDACQQHISAHHLKQPLTYEQLLLEEL